MTRPVAVARRLFIALGALALAACAPDDAGTGDAEGPGGAVSVPDPAGSWTIQQIGDRPVVDGSPASMAFAEDGTVAGNGSCNQFTGGYEINGDRLSLGPLAATSRLCSEEAMNDQEMRLFKALGEVAGFRIEENQLVLLDSAGESLVRASRTE